MIGVDIVIIIIMTAAGYLIPLISKSNGEQWISEVF